MKIMEKVQSIIGSLWKPTSSKKNKVDSSDNWLLLGLAMLPGQNIKIYQGTRLQFENLKGRMQKEAEEHGMGILISDLVIEIRGPAIVTTMAFNPSDNTMLVEHTATELLAD